MAEQRSRIPPTSVGVYRNVRCGDGRGACTQCLPTEAKPGGGTPPSTAGETPTATPGSVWMRPDGTPTGGRTSCLALLHLIVAGRTELIWLLTFSTLLTSVGGFLSRLL